MAVFTAIQDLKMCLKFEKMSPRELSGDQTRIFALEPMNKYDVIKPLKKLFVQIDNSMFKLFFSFLAILIIIDRKIR